MAATLNVMQNIIYICIYICCIYICIYMLYLYMHIYVIFIHMQNIKESENPTNNPGEH